MLYLGFKGSSKRLYINITAIGKILLAILLITITFYVSNQEYLTYIK